MTLTLASLIIVGLFYLALRDRKLKNWNTPKGEFPKKWRMHLASKVNFYRGLNTEEKALFEFKVHEFLNNCEVKGVDMIIDDLDKILVAASAVIPIFKFPAWHYNNIDEVLLYSSSFNEKFETKGEDRNILGMVGSGYMEGKMILSKPALHLGFRNESDKRNTAIHEFIHLVDKADSSVDGIPEVLLQRQYVIPWMKMIKLKTDEINQGNSDINSYAATNDEEFLAVTGEYFFERPQLLKSKHPQLYFLLEKIFQQDMSKHDLKKIKSAINRNDACLCGSGKKYKYCCADKL